MDVIGIGNAFDSADGTSLPEKEGISSPLKGIEDFRDPEKTVDLPEEAMAPPKMESNLSPEVPEALVSGDPDGIAKKLDFNQGDNPYGALGDCGLVSCSNLLEIAGIDADENTVVKYALDNGLCDNTDSVGLWGDDGESRGGTNAQDRIEVLKHFGIDAQEYSGMLADDVAAAVEDGKGVLLGVNAGYLWGDAQYVEPDNGVICANHEITVTGVARNPNTGEVSGFFICDSGRGEKGDAARFLTVDQFNECTNVSGQSTLVTDNPIR